MGILSRTRSLLRLPSRTVGSKVRRPSILMGVTISGSLPLMTGLPERLVEAGWDVHLVSAPGPEIEKYEHVQGVGIHVIPMKRDPAVLHDLIALGRWFMLLHKINPDVVSVGTPKAGFLGIISACTIRGARRVYLLRGLRFESVTGLKRRLLWSVEKLAMMCATDVVAISPSLRAKAIAEHLVKGERIRTVGPGSSNGIELNRYRNERVERVKYLRHSIGLTPGAPVIGFVGRISDDKGLDVLFSASQILIDRGLTHQLLLVGGVEGQWVRKLSDTVRRHPAHVVSVGRVEFVEDYYHLMDVFAFPTLREGFGNVSIEAQAAGLPAVVSNVTGAKDTVADGVSGSLVEAQDPVEWANALGAILEGRVSFDQDKVRAHVEVYDRSSVQESYVDYYLSLMEGSANCHSPLEEPHRSQGRVLPAAEVDGERNFGVGLGITHHNELTDRAGVWS